ncbi:hypothetical protein ACTFIZ_008810 [Dictyostelium cf. discoideum]
METKNLTLNDIKLPKSWETTPNKNEYMDFVFQEAVEMGVWRKHNEIDILTHHHATDAARFFWPTADNEGLILGGELMVLLFAFDDLFDGGFIEDENEQYILVNRMNKVLMEGMLESNSTGIEIMCYHLRNKVKEICGEKRLSTFHRFISICVQWVDSIIPFNKLKNNQKSLELDLFLYHRKYNIGVIPCFAISEIILDPNSIIDPFIWSDARWIKMYEIICQIIAIINDCVSYEKEIKENGAILNSIKFVQIQKNYNLEEAFEYLSNYSNQLIKQYNELSTSFIKSYKTNDINFNSILISIVNNMQGISTASLKWSIQCPRYLSQTQIFVELRRDTNIITKICNLKEKK